MQIHCKGLGDCHKPVKKWPLGTGHQGDFRPLHPAHHQKMTATPRWKRALSWALAREPPPGLYRRKTGGGRRPVGSPARPAGPGRFRGRPARGARGNAPRPLQGRGKTGERNAAQAWVATARVLLTGGRTAPAAPRIRPGSRERRRARRAWREGPR